MHDDRISSGSKKSWPFEGIEKWIGIIGAALLVSSYAVGYPIFANETEALRDERKLIVALFEEASADKQLVEAIKKNDGKLFKLRSIAFSKRKEILGRVETAVASAERIIRCHRSYRCINSDYDIDTEQLLRKFWYFYRPYIIDERGKTIAANLGQLLEEEAGRILDKDKNRGLFHWYKP